MIKVTCSEKKVVVVGTKKPLGYRYMWNCNFLGISIFAKGDFGFSSFFFKKIESFALKFISVLWYGHNVSKKGCCCFLAQIFYSIMPFILWLYFAYIFNDIIPAFGCFSFLFFDSQLIFPYPMENVLVSLPFADKYSK